MVAYEFYWRDPIKGHQLIGTLPERRKNPAHKRDDHSNLNLPTSSSNIMPYDIILVI